MTFGICMLPIISLGECVDDDWFKQSHPVPESDLTLELGEAAHWFCIK
jgi:hypothetical protein